MSERDCRYYCASLQSRLYLICRFSCCSDCTMAVRERFVHTLFRSVISSRYCVWFIERFNLIHPTLTSFILEILSLRSAACAATVDARLSLSRRRSTRPRASFMTSPKVNCACPDMLRFLQSHSQVQLLLAMSYQNIDYTSE